jgi:hypothetical protein
MKTLPHLDWQGKPDNEADPTVPDEMSMPN